MIHFDKINVRESLEDFLKIEYTDGLQNEFNTMEALINHIKKDTLVGKYKTKSFALGVTDNIRMLGNGNDRYVLGVDDYTNAVETVEARFDTTKLMGIFAITDETIVKGTTDGSIFDVLNDSLGRMNLALKHTMNRFTYGSKSGKIGVLNGAATITSATDTMPTLADFVMTNSLSILPGMGVLIVDGENRYQGKVWQKYSAGVGVERIIVLLDADDEPEAIATGAEVYSRQLNAATIVP